MKDFCKKNLKVIITASVLLVALIICSIVVDNGSAEGSRYAMTFMTLFPPVVAIALALATHEVFSSLFIGIVVAALLASNYSFTGTMDIIVNDALISAVGGTAGIFIFLVILGILVALVNKAGGAQAFGRWAKKNIKSKTGAIIATFILGVLIFIDDYFNCLTVGSVMRPVTDSHKISRAKLAYLIDATAAPICMIAPVSSWAAAVAKYAEDGQGIKLFVLAIPFNFYSLLTLVFVVTLAIMGFDYGKMATVEGTATEPEDDEEEGNPSGKVLDLILPIVVLVVANVLALIYVGGFFDKSGGNYLDFVASFADTDATIGLPWGSLIALVLIIVYLVCRKTITMKDAMDSLPKGFIAMVPAILILTFAVALKEVNNSILNLPDYVKGIMENAASGIYTILPAVIFVVACFLAFATGTSWGTFGVLIEIVVAIFPADSTILFIGMSACLAGAVCGDHCSPISDTTIMSSAGAKCNHVEHVQTQLPYAVSVAVISFIMYLVAGLTQLVDMNYGLSAVLCLVLGTALTIGFLFYMKKRQAKIAK
ncbi:MAG: Na+/H+ antiporter NhaC family protein [Lachnospiraceae bacterium]|nr:Na+/H+ antiporter NhaC family protein [Lachnospiraceae bacterium]